MGDSTLGYPEPPGYEADIDVNPQTVGDPLRPSQFASPPGTGVPPSVTGGSMDVRQRKHDLRMSKRLTLTQGTAFGEDLGFNARSLIVDNNSGQWLYDAASRRYIPPGCFGAVLQFPSGSQIGALTWTAPPGVTQPTGVVGSQAVVIYTEDMLDPSAGIISAPGTGQPTGTSGSTAVVGTGTGGAIATSATPATALPLNVSATGAAAASTSAVLPAIAARTTYITGFTVTLGAGTTAASISAVTVTGLTTANGSSGTLTYQVQQETTAGATLEITFPSPIAASAVNSAITVNVPATTNGGVPSVTAYGFAL